MTTTRQLLSRFLYLSMVFFIIYGVIAGACAGAETGNGKTVGALTDLDFNDDGYINQLDLDILRSHFNERYGGYVPWDLNADLRCDHKDFYYFADHVPLNYRYQVEESIPIWNLSDYTLEQRRKPTFILDEVVYPQNPERVITWIKQYTSLESPKKDSAVCVHYTRDLCRLAYKSLGPKTVAWGSSGSHAYGMVYTGGNWRRLSNWAIIDPYWKYYSSENHTNSKEVYDTTSIELFLDEGQYGYWAIHLSANHNNNTVFEPYKAEYRVRDFRETH